MIATYVPPQLYKYSKLEASTAYWKACVDVGLEPSVELVSVLTGHGAHESGNFQLGCWNNNAANIKAGEAYVGEYTCITLNEMLRDPKTGQVHERWFAPEGELTGNPRKGGVLRHPQSVLPVPPGHAQTRMRSFRTLDDGLEDKLRFFMKPEWIGVLDPAKKGDAAGFVRAIRKRRYFTAYLGTPLDEVTPYETSVVSLARTYRPYVKEAAAIVALGGRLPPVAPRISHDDRARNEAMRFDFHDLLRGRKGSDPESVT